MWNEFDTPALKENKNMKDGEKIMCDRDWMSNWMLEYGFGLIVSDNISVLVDWASAHCRTHN